jgi:DNA-binding transcriptional ArsR family regulator
LRSSRRSLTELALKELRHAIKEEPKYEYNWFQYFHFADDPTKKQPIASDFDATFVDRENETRMLATILASAAKGSSATVFFVGPQGSGRTSLVNFLLHLNQLAEAQSVEVALPPIKDLVLYKPDKVTNYFTQKISSQTKLLVLDDCQELGANLSDIVKMQLANQPLKLLVTTPAHLIMLREHEEFTMPWKTAFVTPLEEKDAISFLKDRIIQTMNDSVKHSAIIESESMLKIICEFGMGVPGLMLDLLKYSLLLAYHRNKETLDKETVTETCTKGGYCAAVEQMIKSKLSEKMFEMLLTLHLLTNFAPGPQGFEGATANQLEDGLEVDRSTIVHYLTELYEAGLVTKQKKGKPVYYKLTVPAETALELECVRRLS